MEEKISKFEKILSKRLFQASAQLPTFWGHFYLLYKFFYHIN